MATISKDKTRFKPRSTSNIVSSFIRKTYELLEDQRFPEIVDWNSEGTALVIKKPVEFGQKVLPAYFKHNNLTSFVRQLNMYDFHKRRTQQYDHVYYHDLFQKGKKHLLKEIRRKNQDHTLASIQKAIENLESVQGNITQDTTSNAYENQLLKKLNKDALGRISSLEGKVRDLSIQNQALWNQVNEHSQKEGILVSFIKTIMKQRGISDEELPKILLKELTGEQMQSASNKMSEALCRVNSNQTDLSNGCIFFKDENSTEISSSSPDPRDQGDLDKHYRNAESFVPKNECSGSEPESKLSACSMGYNTCASQSNDSNFTLETQYMKTFSKLDSKCNQNILGRGNYDCGMDILGKRRFGPDGEGFETELEREVKGETFNTSQDGSMFFGKFGGMKEDLADLKVKNQNSAEFITDFGGNTQNSFDLMDFTQII